MELQDLQKQRDIYIHNLFWLALKIAIFFAVPAVGAALLGKYLDSLYGGGKTYTILLLAGAFILSWVITLRQFSIINRKIKDIETKIQELKQKKNDA